MRRMPIDFCRSNDSNRKWPPKWPPPVTRSTSRNASKKKIKKIKIKQKKNRRIQEPNLRNQKKEKERKIPLRPPSESITFFRSVFFCNWNPMILVFNFLLMLFFIVFFCSSCWMNSWIMNRDHEGIGFVFSRWWGYFFFWFHCCDEENRSIDIKNRFVIGRWRKICGRLCGGSSSLRFFSPQQQPL